MSAQVLSAAPAVAVVVPSKRTAARARRDLVRSVGYYTLCTLVTLVVLSPVILVVGSSFKSSHSLFAVPPAVFPSSPTLASYQALFDTTPFLRNIVNSLVVGIVVSAVAVLVGTAGGYAIAREKFRGRAIIRIGSLVWYMFPPMLIMIPLYLEFSQVGLVNNDLGVGVAFLTFTIPFSVWMMTAFFQQVPYELDEAAWLDGASKWATLWRIALPIARPGMAACFVTAFMMTWGDYLFSVTLLSSGSTYTVGAGLNSLIGTVGIAYGQLLAGTVIVLVVPIGILAVGRKWFTRGLVSGALK